MEKQKLITKSKIYLFLITMIFMMVFVLIAWYYDEEIKNINQRLEQVDKAVK